MCILPRHFRLGPLKGHCGANQIPAELALNHQAKLLKICIATIGELPRVCYKSDLAAMPAMRSSCFRAWASSHVRFPQHPTWYGDPLRPA